MLKRLWDMVKAALVPKESPQPEHKVVIRHRTRATAASHINSVWDDEKSRRDREMRLRKSALLAERIRQQYNHNHQEERKVEVVTEEPGALFKELQRKRMEVDSYLNRSTKGKFVV